MKPNQSMQANLWPFRCLIHNTSTKFARAATNAALILSPMRCHSAGFGMASRTRRTQTHNLNLLDLLDGVAYPNN